MRIFCDSRPATLSDVSLLRRAMCAQLEHLRLKPEVIDDLAIVVSEVGANIVRHSAPAATEINVEVDLTGHALKIRILDDGGPFRDFNAVPSRNDTASILDESGRGLALVKSALESVRYEPGTPNILTGWRNLAASRPCVLIIEDTPALLDLYSGMLSTDYNVICCSSLQDARLALQGVHVDIVLADLHLEDGSSSILLDEPEQSTDMNPPPIVFISSNQAHHVRETCLRQGAEFFISKPVNARDLRKTLALAISRAGLRSAKLNRTFARHVNALIDNLLPSRLGAYRVASLGASASTGGGDIVIRHQLQNAERVIIADVMGHGVAARAWAISLSATIRTLHHFRPDLTCGGFITELARLTWDDPALQGAMATVLVADLDDAGVTIASAGHPAPFVVGADIRRIDVGGPLLGVVAPLTFEDVHVELSRRERLFLFTDGIDHHDETGGECLPSWMNSVLRGHAKVDLLEVAQELAASAQANLGPQPRDDWTLVVLERI